MAALLLPETYFELVRAFPLAPIRDDDHLDAATEFLNNHVLRLEMDEGVGAYLEVLSDLIEAFEDEHYPIRDAAPGEVLRLLMESNDLTQASLGKAVGISQSTISAILTGARRPTAQHIAKLSAYFNVGPGAFMPNP